MYISVRDRPDAQSPPTAKRVRVAPIVIGLGMVSLFTDISSESVSAILPLYLTGVIGLSTISYGFIDGLYQGISALVRIAGGWAADRLGHPKWIALVGYALSCVARIGFLFASTFAGISAVVTADRIGKGVRTAPRDAMIADATPPEHLGRAFGVHRTLDTLGAVIGPLLAFLVLWWIPDGYHTVMVISLAAAVVGVALLTLLIPDASRSLRRNLPEPAPLRLRSLGNPQLTKLFVVAGALALLTVGDGFIYLALLARGDFATHWFPLLYVGTNLAYLALATPIGGLADRVGRARILVLGHVALVGAYLCAAMPLPSTAGTIAALALLGTFYAATDGLTAALAGSHIEPEARASGIAGAQTVVAIARLISSGAFGILWFAIGPASALTLIAALLILAVPVGLVVLKSLDRAQSPA
jgi:MFS family permease